MKVQELVEKFEANQRIDIAKTIETKKYVGIAFKQKMAQLILDNCTTIVDGEVYIDSVTRYILFTISVISMHTNLEFADIDDDSHSAIDDYDLLCESGLLGKIIDTFRDDYASCQEILNMMTSDKMQEHMTIEKKINSLLDGIHDIISEVLGTVAGQLDVNELLDLFPVDQTKLLDFYNSIKQE